MTAATGRVPVSRAIHYLWLGVAHRLIEQAGQLVADASPEAQARMRSHCGAAESMACAALEGWANVFLAFWHERKRQTDPSLPSWDEHTRRTKWYYRTRLGAKWSEIAQILPADCLTQVDPNWEDLVGRMAVRRNDLLHFKGAYGPSDIEPMYGSLCPERSSAAVTFARDLINACHKGYEQKYHERFTYGPEPHAAGDSPPRPPWVWPAASPPIGTAVSELTIQHISRPTPPIDQ